MKINHILFPVDFSEHSQGLHSDIEWLASHFNAQVTLLNVFEVPTSWYGGGEAPMMSGEDFVAYADAEKQRLQNYAIGIPETRIKRVSAEGSAASHIAQLAKDHDVDLIVMGTHGYGAFRRLLLGSVAMKVLHDVACPVWTHSALTAAGREQELGVARIVCSIELSEEAVPLLRFTRELADEFGATVFLVHSVPETASRPAKYFDYDLHSFLKAAEEEIAKLQLEAGTDFPIRITQRFIAQDVCEVAAEQRADLIVIGRGVVQGTLGRWRTHAYEIIRQAPCPVLSYSVLERESEIRRKDNP